MNYVHQVRLMIIRVGWPMNFVHLVSCRVARASGVVAQKRLAHVRGQPHRPFDVLQNTSLER